MRARLTASVLLGSLVIALTSGCTFMTDQATMQPYDPSDGTSAVIDGVKVLNILMLSEDGETASLLMNIANEANSSATVNVQYENAAGQKVDESVHVNANAVKSVGNQPDATLIMKGIDGAPGSLFPVFLQIGDAAGQQVQVPVLDGSLPYYADLLP